MEVHTEVCLSYNDNEKMFSGLFFFVFFCFFLIYFVFCIGQLVFVIAESLIGKPIPRKAKETIIALATSILLGLRLEDP